MHKWTPTYFNLRDYRMQLAGLGEFTLLPRALTLLIPVGALSLGNIKLDMALKMDAVLYLPRHSPDWLL